MEVQVEKKTVPKIDAEKVSKNHGKRSQFGRRQGSKNPPTLGVAKQTELLGGGLPPPYPPPLGHPSPKRPKKIKWCKK